MREATKGELSKKNKYYIPKYRYYELKYRCLQYPDWIREYGEIGRGVCSRAFENDRVDGGMRSDIVFLLASSMEEVKHRIDIIDNIIFEQLPKDLQDPIKEAVTKGKGWTVIQAKYELTCTRQEYYDAYHKFFWLYDKLA